MDARSPRNVEEYLSQLYTAMRGDDPAILQDALYDAEEYLRAELAQTPGRPVSEVIAEVVAGYGAPEEVADAYRQTEQTVAEALRTPTRDTSPSILGKLFGPFVDLRTYAAIFYMLLSLATGIVYFVLVVTGISLSMGLAITLLGIPLFLLFVGVVRLFSLLEGRIVETMLGVRMPRRPLYPAPPDGIFARIGRMLTDPRTWSTMLYMVAMLPLGVVYFTVVVTGFAVSLATLFAPLAWMLGYRYLRFIDQVDVKLWEAMLLGAAGFIGIVVMLHLCRLIGTIHGQFAKYLLVRHRAVD